MFGQVTHFELCNIWKVHLWDNKMVLQNHSLAEGNGAFMHHRYLPRIFCVLHLFEKQLRVPASGIITGAHLWMMPDYIK